MNGRPSLLMVMAAVATLSTVANAIAAAPASDLPQTRLGTAINQDLAKRDQSGAARNRALSLREQVARAAEERIKANARARQQEAAAAAAAAATASAAPGDKAIAPNAQYDDLARIYQAMKPARAALVLEQLDMDVQMQVAQRMRQRSTAMILAAMTPAGAADLSMSLARKTPRRRVVPPIPKPAAAAPAAAPIPGPAMQTAGR
jgi:flagellar motility protein MotE (MotC chaperone)